MFWFGKPERLVNQAVFSLGVGVVYSFLFLRKVGSGVKIWEHFFPPEVNKAIRSSFSFGTDSLKIWKHLFRSPGFGVGKGDSKAGRREEDHLRAVFGTFFWIQTSLLGWFQWAFRTISGCGFEFFLRGSSLRE